MKTLTVNPLSIRSLTQEDARSIADIERHISGRYRPQYWERKLEVCMTNQEPCVGIELRGRLVGVMLGRLKTGEFGAGDGAAWLEILVIDPELLGCGLGRDLFNYFCSYFQRIGVNRVYTLVPWDDRSLVGFFNALGFQRSPFLSLETES